MAMSRGSQPWWAAVGAIADGTPVRGWTLADGTSLRTLDGHTRVLAAPLKRQENLVDDAPPVVKRLRPTVKLERGWGPFDEDGFRLDAHA